MRDDWNDPDVSGAVRGLVKMALAGLVVVLALAALAAAVLLWLDVPVLTQ